MPKLIVGSDYLCFYGATKNLLLHGTPYEKGWYKTPVDEYAKPLVRFAYNPTIPWYCFPPVSASLNYLLSNINIDLAAKFSFFLLLACVVISFGLIVAAFDFREKKERWIIFLYGVVAIFFSYPVYFLIARGHLIGITFFLVAAGLYLLKWNNFFSGVCFGVATGMFLFPGLIVVPLLLFRRYKIIISMGATLLFLVFLCPDLWGSFFKDIFMLRIATKDILQQNCSLAAVFLNGTMIIEKALRFFGRPIKFSHLYYEIALIVYAFLFFSMVVCDIIIYQKKRIAIHTNLQLVLFFMYIPFMIAVPKAIFPYTLVPLLFFIPIASVLTHDIFSKQLFDSISILFIVGIILSQFPAQGFEMLFTPTFFSFHFFPALGLLLVMIGCVIFKARLCRANPL